MDPFGRVLESSFITVSFDEVNDFVKVHFVPMDFVKAHFVFMDFVKICFANFLKIVFNFTVLTLDFVFF